MPPSGLNGMGTGAEGEGWKLWHAQMCTEIFGVKQNKTISNWVNTDLKV